MTVKQLTDVLNQFKPDAEVTLLIPGGDAWRGVPLERVTNESDTDNTVLLVTPLWTAQQPGGTYYVSATEGQELAG